MKLKNKKTLFWGIAIAFTLIAVTALVIWTRKNKEEEQGKPAPVGGGETSSGSVSGTNKEDPIFIGLGSRGDSVKRLQSYLNAHISPMKELAVDGIWGERTQDAFAKVFGDIKGLTKSMFDEKVKAK